MKSLLGSRGWKSYLIWEGLPLLLPLSLFLLIAAINWEYENKLIFPDSFSTGGWTSVHMGLILLAVALGMSLLGSLSLFLVRVVALRISNPGGSMAFAFVSLILVTILWILPALFIVILGPASITMIDQMNSAHR
jgi:hypothetical protein